MDKRVVIMIIVNPKVKGWVKLIIIKDSNKIKNVE